MNYIVIFNIYKHSHSTVNLGKRTSERFAHGKRPSNIDRLPTHCCGMYNNYFSSGFKSLYYVIILYTGYSNRDRIKIRDIIF